MGSTRALSRIAGRSPTIKRAVIAIGSSLVRVGAEPISAAPAWRGGNGLLGDHRQRNTMPAHERLAAAVQRFAGVAACVSIVVAPWHVLDAAHDRHRRAQTNQRHVRAPRRDELILAVAQILTSELRVTDTVARLGGDEFAAVLPHVDTDGARVTAAKLVDALARSSRELGGQTLASTISAGIAVANGNAPDAITLSRTADEALYEAKASGGNGYAIAAPHEDLSEP